MGGVDRDEQMLEPNEDTQNTTVWYKNLSLYGAAGCIACLFFFKFIYKVWHLAFYCQTSIFLTANFLLIQRSSSNASEKLNLKSFLKNRAQE